MQEHPEHPNVKCKKNTEEPEKTNIKTYNEVASSSKHMQKLQGPQLRLMPPWLQFQNGNTWSKKSHSKQREELQRKLWTQ